MLYPTVNDDDDEVDQSDEDDAVSSQSELDDDYEPEGELQTLVTVTENILPQWESGWFSSARYDYIHSGALLNMGSGSPIDDLVESGTIRQENKKLQLTIHEKEYTWSDLRLGFPCVEKMGQEQILMCQRYIRDKRTEELTKRIFIWS
ncbi:hypothetical protein M9H77_31203 [Catharanthus roseus]|uniref:Uncharacterized protein n=1 Tax=Catharanthus roseus TaxID=4058 RepID=A0ACC0A3B6_CATRO|nr:hypothetical protein M9H77_31203 [Catharanthus roseus]